MFVVALFKRWTAGLSPAYAAALALIIIQVSIGLLYKAAQTNGKYAFSASSSVTISEFSKFLLSTAFFATEWRARKHALVPSSEEEEEVLKMEELEDGKEREEDDDSSSASIRLSEEDYAGNLPWMNRARDSTPLEFIQAVRNEVASDVRYGFAHLALFYVVMNNMIFILFRLADPGTIQLIKSGTILITAVVMILTLGTHIAGNQWIAICMQVCGIVITQYNPTGGSTYPILTYGLLIFHTTMSAVSSVYNQMLCKNEGSLHAMNMTLYSSGAAINFILHIMIRILNPDEPGFFTGYGNIGAIMVIVSNVFIGLAMTAVYKYADAIIKCFATAISTGLLLYISPLYFDVDFSFLVIPGTAIVFLATYLYMVSSPAKPTAPPSSIEAKLESVPEEDRPFYRRVFFAVSPKGSFRSLGLAGTTTFAFMLLTIMTAYRIQLNKPLPTAVTPPLEAEATNSTFLNELTNSTLTNMTAPSSLPSAVPTSTSSATPQATTFESPFKNVLASIRINHDLPERIPTLRNAYEPFFHSVHISMPSDGVNASLTNITHDYWNNGEMPYPPVTATVQLLLDDPDSADIEGILWYHFDTWIEPLSFTGMDFEKIWQLDSNDGPPFQCMTNPKLVEWWPWVQWGKQDAVREASHLIKERYPEYMLDPEEFCASWADMYYLPRKYFADFVRLSTIYAETDSYHEIAIPTMFHIIDQTYRAHPSLTVLYHWADCWGNCCKDNPSTYDVLRKRCGHKLNYLDPNVTNTFYERLDENALLLGMPLPGIDERPGTENPEIGWEVNAMFKF